jgi:hypothetical protein
MAGTAANHRSEKNAGKKSLIKFLTLAARSSLLVVAAIILCGATLRGEEDLAHLQQRFDSEKNGVSKAKLLQKLGDAQFSAERAAANANDYSTVGLVMEKYRDNVRAALDALKKSHPDAEKHSSGYKQLEIHLGKGLREIRDVLIAVPEPFRPPMQLVAQDLRDMDMELLRLLFPRRPGEQPPMQPEASTPVKPAQPPEKQP